MLVPKAPVDEHDLLSRSEDEIRFARKLFSMESVPIAQAVNGAPYEHLRFHTFAANGPHVLAAAGFRQMISQIAYSGFDEDDPVSSL